MRHFFAALICAGTAAGAQSLDDIDAVIARDLGAVTCGDLLALGDAPLGDATATLAQVSPMLEGAAIATGSSRDEVFRLVMFSCAFGGEDMTAVAALAEAVG